MIFKNIAVVLVLCVATLGQTKNFTPVEGANLKARIESANLGKIAGQKSLGALTSTVDGDAEIELQKQAVLAIGVVRKTKQYRF